MGISSSIHLSDEIASRQASGIDLRRELGRLAACRSVSAWEAVVLYCGRIVESLTTAAIAEAGFETGNLFGCIELLERYALCPTHTLHWVNAVRRITNDVRHVHRAIAADEAEAAVAIVEPFLHWFFCRREQPSRLASLSHSPAGIGLGVEEDIARFMRAFEVGPDHVLDLADGGREPSFLRTSLLPTVLAQILLDRDHPAAASVLDAALGRHPTDLRLLQLHALRLSRAKRLDDAIDCLERLRRDRGEDADGAGILGGAYKRAWEANGGADALARSHDAYARGWKKTDESVPYLGINAAATALWLRRAEAAKAIAAKVLDLLLRWQRRRPALHVWHRLSLAEARLLSGHPDEARRQYREAAAVFPDERAAHRVARHQLVRHLEALGDPLSVEEFLAPRVAVTGHRALPGDIALGARLDEVLAALERALGSGACVLSSLAEGADRLVAERVLATGGRLHAVLPMPPDEYAHDFAGAESRAEFLTLCARAYRSTCLREAPTSPTARDAAYEAAGHFVADACDVLIAIWDGAPARGIGGTAAIVQYARDQARPIAWIHTKPPFEIRYERLDRFARAAG